MPPFKGNIAPAQKDDADCPNIIPDNTSSVREEPWTHTTPSAPTGSGSVAPQPLTSALPSVSSDMEKSPFTPGCLDKVKNLVSKESTRSTLLSIQKDEAASCIEGAATQAFEVETEKEGSGEESDGGGTEPHNPKKVCAKS